MVLVCTVHMRERSKNMGAPRPEVEIRVPVRDAASFVARDPVPTRAHHVRRCEQAFHGGAAASREDQPT